MTIEAYMKHLTDDASALAAFQGDAVSAMTSFGLSAADQAIVLTSDATKIRAAVAKVDPEGARSMQITLHG